MATVSKGKTFTTNEEVTNTKLHQLVDSATVSAIVSADISNDQIDSQHYAAGSVDLEHMSANSVDSDQYVDGSVDNIHLAGSIEDSKLNQIVTASKVSGLALTALASIPAGAGNVPAANLGNAVSFYIGSFNRDISTASGAQAVTGVGFQPTVLILFVNQNATAKTCFGFTDGTTQGSIHDYQNETADVWGTNSNAIFVVHSTSNYYAGSITTMGADGFTIDWTKTGSPTGTIVSTFIAMA